MSEWVGCVRVCVCVCACACVRVRACVCVCVYVQEWRDDDRPAELVWEGNRDEKVRFGEDA